MLLVITFGARSIRMRFSLSTCYISRHMHAWPCASTMVCGAWRPLHLQRAVELIAQVTKLCAQLGDLAILLNEECLAHVGNRYTFDGRATTVRPALESFSVTHRRLFRVDARLFRACLLSCTQGVQAAKMKKCGMLAEWLRVVFCVLRFI